MSPGRQNVFLQAWQGFLSYGPIKFISEENFYHYNSFDQPFHDRDYCDSDILDQ